METKLPTNLEALVGLLATAIDADTASRLPSMSDTRRDWTDQITTLTQKAFESGQTFRQAMAHEPEEPKALASATGSTARTGECWKPTGKTTMKSKAVQSEAPPAVAVQRPCSAGASAINDVEEWRIACNWKNTNPDWDATLKIVIAFAREGQRLAARPNK